MPIDLDVLQVVTSSHRRGAESFAVDLGDALADEVRSIETVALRAAVGQDGFDLPVLASGPHSRRGDLAAVRRLRARSAAADVLVAHGSSTLWTTALATLGTRTPFVYRLIGDPSYWVSSPARRARVRVLLGRAAAVAVYHLEARDTLVRIHGLTPSRIHVIGKGLPVERHPEITADERAEARRRFDLGSDRPVVACVGALSAEKDVTLAVEAVSKMASPGVHLLVAGGGPEQAALEGLTARLGIAATFLGPTGDARRVMAAADVVVLTSRTEGIPSVLIEAGLAGLPTVTTDVGGVRAVVDDGVTGEVVGERDPRAVAAALDRAIAERVRLGRAARAHCSRAFAMGPVAERWAALLADVTGRAAPRA